MTSFIEIDFHKLFIVIINTLGIWLVIMVQSSKKKESQSHLFTLMTIAMLWWINFAYFAHIVESVRLSVIFLKTTWFITPPFFLFLHYFSIELVKKIRKYRLLTVVNTVITIILSLVTGFTDWIIAGRIIVNGSLTIKYGVGMWPFLVCVTVLMVSVIYVIFRESHTLSKENRQKTTPYVIGLSIFYVANLIFNIALPIFLGITRLYYIGDYSTVVLMSLIAYAVARHKFLNVKMALSAFLVSSIGLILVVDLLVFSATVGERILKGVSLGLYLIIAVLLIKTLLKEQEQRERLTRANKRINVLAQEQKDIIDVMGHEIRTPLTAIVQEIKLSKQVVYPNEQGLLDGTLDDKTRRQMVELLFDSCKTIDNASMHAVVLVNDMLETARLDKKKLSLNYEEFELIELIKTSVETMSRTTSKDKADIKLKKPGYTKLNVKADKTRIREAIFALLSNAIKYKDTKKDKATIIVSLKVKGRFAYISLKDDGLGIKKEDIAKLGRKFFRLESQMSESLKRPGGTGLGLFVTKGIMEKHGGRLIIKSNGLGKGSTFTLKFPVKGKKR